MTNTSIKKKYRNIGLLLILCYLVLLSLLNFNDIFFRQYTSILLDVIGVIIFVFLFLSKNRKLLLIGLIIKIVGLNVSIIGLQLIMVDLLKFETLLNFKYYFDSFVNLFLIVGFFDFLGNTKINSIVSVDLKSILLKSVIFTFFIQVIFYLSQV